MARAATYQEIAQSIAQQISSVADVGQVHEYQRFFLSEAKFKALMYDQSNGDIRGWNVTRESFSQEHAADHSNTRISTFVIRGFMAVDDTAQSEITFEKLIDSVTQKFEAQQQLADTVELTYPPQLRSSEYGEIFGVTCHVCEITLDVQEHFSSS